MINCTEVALERLQQKIERKQVWGIRLMLKPNGCNGWSYDLSYLEGILFTVWLGILYYGKCWIDSKFK